MISIYDKDLNFKITLNYTKEEFLKNPQLMYKDFLETDYISNEKINYPVLENGELREMTREERILKLGHIELLHDGEKIVNSNILYIKIPTSLIKPVWNIETGEWVEGAKKEDLVELRKEKRLRYSKLKEEREVLANDEFADEEELHILDAEIEELKKEIIELGEKIKIL